jgi:hypothetical protein
MMTNDLIKAKEELQKILDASTPENLDEKLKDFVEGVAPLSHDSSIQRAVRKHRTPRSKKHMSGSDRYRRPDPMKKIQMRTRRASRHQPKPEIDEAANFLIKNWGKSLTEDDLKAISDRSLLTHAVDALANMAFGGWEESEQGVTNNSYILEGEELSLKDGQLHYKNSPVQLNWDWLYSVRQLLQKGQ